ncbi:MAG: hypothetical protein PUF10_02690 [Bacteroidales bacterium]|nr:hypothetical protein [Bacteroidales bacterium]
MNKNQLVQSGVIFDPAAHTYRLGDKMLSGITGIIKNLVFPDMYADIPAHILNAAADRGHEIHRCIQEYVDGCAVPFLSDEVEQFKAATEGIEFIASEYLVTDGAERYASAIDLVDSECNLYDIKTTSKLNIEYLQWQLSIYADFFERQNGVEAGKLYALHVRDGQCRMVEVERLPSEWTARLLDCGYTGEVFENPMKKETLPTVFDSKQIQRAKEVEALIVARKNELKRLEDEMKLISDYFKDIMTANGLKSFESDQLKITIKDGYVRDGIDTKRLKEEKPDVWEEYYKPTNVSGSITIKVK